MGREAEWFGIRFQVWLFAMLFLLLLISFRLAIIPPGTGTGHSTITPAQAIVFPSEAPALFPAAHEFRQRSFEETHHATLLQQLSDPDAAIRLNALIELAAMETNAATLVPALTACLNDSDPEIRARAALELGFLRMAGADAVPRLKVLASKDADEQVRSRARDALYNIRLYDYAPSAFEGGTPVP